MRARARRLRAGAAVAAVLAAVAAPAAADGPRTVQVRPAEAFRRVAAFDAAGEAVGTGSAVAIAPGRYLTACHVLAGADGIELRGTTGAMHPARLAGAVRSADVCLLHLADESGPGISRADTSPAVGERLRVIGTVASGQTAMLDLRVRARVTVARVPLVLVDEAIPPGFSGAVGLSDAGRIAALAVGRWPWVGLGVLVDLTATPRMLDRVTPATTSRGLRTTPPFLDLNRHGVAIALAALDSGVADIPETGTGVRAGPWRIGSDAGVCTLHAQSADGATRVYLRLLRRNGDVAVTVEARHGPLALAQASARLSLQVLPQGDTVRLTAQRLDRAAVNGAAAWNARWRAAGDAVRDLLAALPTARALVFTNQTGRDVAVLDVAADGFARALVDACLQAAPDR
jgi:hypothetical protein